MILVSRQARVLFQMRRRQVRGALTAKPPPPPLPPPPPPPPPPPQPQPPPSLPSHLNHATLRRNPLSLPAEFSPWLDASSRISPDAWYQRVVAFQSHQGLVFALLAGVSGAALIAGGEGTSQNPPREFPRSRGTTGTGNGTGNQATDDLRRYDDAVERADSGKATARAPCNEDRPRTGALRWMAADALGLSHLHRELSGLVPCLHIGSFFVSLQGIMSSLNMTGFASAWTAGELHAFSRTMGRHINHCGYLMVLNCATLATGIVLHVDHNYELPVACIALGCFGSFFLFLTWESWFFLRATQVMRSAGAAIGTSVGTSAATKS